MSGDSLHLGRDEAYMIESEVNEIIEKSNKNDDSIHNKKELIHVTHNKGSQHAEGKKDVESKAKKTPARVVEKGPPKMKFSRSQIRQIFEEHDVDGDGCLDLNELTKAFGFLGSIIPLYKAHYGMAYADADGDGLIDEEEFEKLIDYAERISKKRTF